MLGADWRRPGSGLGTSRYTADIRSIEINFMALLVAAHCRDSWIFMIVDNWMPRHHNKVTLLPLTSITNFALYFSYIDLILEVSLFKACYYCLGEDIYVKYPWIHHQPPRSNVLGADNSIRAAVRCAWLSCLMTARPDWGDSLAVLQFLINTQRYEQYSEKAPTSAISMLKSLWQFW